MVHTRQDGGCVHCWTQNLELRVCFGSAEHGRWVGEDLQATLGISPNLNGIFPLHLLVTLNTDPWSVMAQWVGQQKREGVAGGSVLASVENLSVGAGVGMQKESWRQLRMVIG